MAGRAPDSLRQPLFHPGRGLDYAGQEPSRGNGVGGKKAEVPGLPSVRPLVQGG